MFSLMCFFEKPLFPETHASLRELARECIKVRIQLVGIFSFILFRFIYFYFLCKNNPDDEKLNELNFFISIIGRYFEQIDLADEDL